MSNLCIYEPIILKHKKKKKRKKYVQCDIVDNYLLNDVVCYIHVSYSLLFKI